MLLRPLVPKDLTAAEILLIRKVGKRALFGSPEDYLGGILLGDAVVWRVEQSSGSGVVITRHLREEKTVLIDGLSGKGLLKNLEEIVDKLERYASMVGASRLLAFARPGFSRKLSAGSRVKIVQHVLERRL